MTLGDRISELRLARGWNREMLAVAAGVSASTIRRVEVGEIRPRPFTLLAIAEALGADPRELAKLAGVALYVPPDRWS